jgi:hypothetical protein
MTSADLFTVAPASIRTAQIDTAARSIKRSRRIPFIAHEPDGSSRTITPAGRDAWALGHLIVAGGAGCTPIEHIGPRWSH